MKRQTLSLNILDLRLKQASYHLHVFEILLTQEINAFVVTAPAWESSQKSPACNLFLLPRTRYYNSVIEHTDPQLAHS